MWFSTLLIPLLVSFVGPADSNHEDELLELEWISENFMNAEHDETIAALERLLAAMSRGPDHASARVPDAVLRGWVILAGLRLVQGDGPAADAAMDEGIRVARGQLLPVRDYGPQISELYKDRRLALQAAGMATIEVECHAPCRVVIDERLVPDGEQRLFLGTYRVWIHADERGWASHAVELDEPGELVKLVVGEPAPLIVSPPPPMTTPHHKIPEGVLVAGFALGAGMVIAGTVLQVNESLGPRDEPTYAGRYGWTNPFGPAMLGVGGGLLIVSGVLAVIDVRLRKRGRRPPLTAGLIWRF